jgi:hypothetical protein
MSRTSCSSVIACHVCSPIRHCQGVLITTTVDLVRSDVSCSTNSLVVGHPGVAPTGKVRPSARAMVTVARPAGQGCGRGGLNAT